jgi:hypothetical protein
MMLSLEGTISDSAPFLLLKWNASSMNSYQSNKGGESHLQLASDDWHQKHPEAAKDYFGFYSFDETKLYVALHFTEVEIKSGKLKFSVTSGTMTVVPQNLTEFEQILLVKYFIQSTPICQWTGSVFGVSHPTAHEYLKRWGPRWAKYGEHLLILPMP